MQITKLSIVKFLLDLLFPAKCLGCGERPVSVQRDGSEEWICNSCFDGIKLKTGFECAFCLSRTVNGETCPFCKKENWLDYLWIAANYDDSVVKRALWAFKYKFISSLKFPLGRLVLKFLREKKKDEFIKNYREQILMIPVPLHRLRLNWRSYNQSELLARELALVLDIETDAGVLVRTQNKKPQMEIKGREERVANAKGIFVCGMPEKVKGKVVILIDDITTTASTLNECARALKQAGTEKVIGLVVARG